MFDVGLVVPVSVVPLVCSPLDRRLQAADQIVTWRIAGPVPKALPPKEMGRGRRAVSQEG